MCIACEMRMMFAMEDLAPSTGTASHEPATDAQRFACDSPDEATSEPAQAQDARKPFSDKP